MQVPRWIARRKWFALILGVALVWGSVISIGFLAFGSGTASTPTAPYLDSQLRPDSLLTRLQATPRLSPSPTLTPSPTSTPEPTQEPSPVVAEFVSPPEIHQPAPSLQSTPAAQSQPVSTPKPTPEPAPTPTPAPVATPTPTPAPAPILQPWEAIFIVVQAMEDGSGPSTLLWDVSPSSCSATWEVATWEWDGYLILWHVWCRGLRYSPLMDKWYGSEFTVCLYETYSMIVTTCP